MKLSTDLVQTINDALIPYGFVCFGDNTFIEIEEPFTENSCKIIPHLYRDEDNDLCVDFFGLNFENKEFDSYEKELLYICDIFRLHNICKVINDIITPFPDILYSY